MASGINSGGIWKPFVNIFVKQAGVWKQVLNGYVKQGGVWKQFTSSFIVACSYIGDAFDYTGSSASIWVHFFDNGRINTTFQDNTYNLSWGTPFTTGIGANYWVKIVKSSGVTTGATGTMTPGVWYQLNVMQTYQLNVSSAFAARQFNGNYYISTDGTDAGIIASNQLFLELAPV